MSDNGPSDKRLKDVLSFVNDHGREEASEHFDLSISTLKRYRRRARQRGLDIEEDYEEPKILVFDVECSPIECYAWSLGKEYLNHENLIKGKSLLSWSAKWLDDTEIMSDRVTVEEAKNRDDSSIIKELHGLLNKCDAALGHNIRSFDQNLVNTRFLDNGLPPTSPYQCIDTYRQASKNMSFLSNSLDFISKKLCEDKQDKLDHSMELWRRCVTGDSEALEEMEHYNQIDVRVVEDIHYKLRPYYTSGVNVALYHSKDKGDRCPRCGSKDLEESDSSYFTSTGKYRVFRCRECGGLGRSRFCSISTEERRNIRRTLAR